MQGRSPAYGAHHLHAAALAVGALYINDFVVLTHRQIHWLLRELVQLAHGHQRCIAHIEAAFDQIAQL